MEKMRKGVKLQINSLCYSSVLVKKIKDQRNRRSCYSDWKASELNQLVKNAWKRCNYSSSRWLRETLHLKLRSLWNGRHSISFLKMKMTTRTDGQQTIYIISSQSTKYFLELSLYGVNPRTNSWHHLNQCKVNIVYWQLDPLSTLTKPWFTTVNTIT